MSCLMVQLQIITFLSMKPEFMQRPLASWLQNQCAQRQGQSQPGRGQSHHLKAPDDIQTATTMQSFMSSLVNLMTQWGRTTVKFFGMRSLNNAETFWGSHWSHWWEKKTFWTEEVEQQFCLALEAFWCWKWGCLCPLACQQAWHAWFPVQACALHHRKRTFCKNDQRVQGPWPWPWHSCQEHLLWSCVKWSLHALELVWNVRVPSATEGTVNQFSDLRGRSACIQHNGQFWHLARSRRGSIGGDFSFFFARDMVFLHVPKSCNNNERNGFSSSQLWSEQHMDLPHSDNTSPRLSQDDNDLHFHTHIVVGVGDSKHHAKLWHQMDFTIVWVVVQKWQQEHLTRLLSSELGFFDGCFCSQMSNSRTKTWKNANDVFVGQEVSQENQLWATSTVMIWVHWLQAHQLVRLFVH